MKAFYSLLIIMMFLTMPNKTAKANMTMEQCRAVTLELNNIYAVDKKCPFLNGDEYASLTNVKNLINKLCQNKSTYKTIWHEKCVSPKTIKAYKKAYIIIKSWEK